MSKGRIASRLTRRGALKALGLTGAGLAVAYVFGRDLVPILPSLGTPDFNDGTAWIKVGPEGKVSMLCPIHEMGQGSSLGMAQIVAEELNIDVADIQVSFPSTHDAPGLRFTTGSLGIVEHARPMAEAAARLREELRRRAAIQASADAMLLTDEPGGFSTPDGKNIPYEQIVDDSDLILEAGALPPAQVYTFDADREHQQIGRSAWPIQSGDIVTGMPVFAADIMRPGLVFGRAVQAPSPNAQITSVDFGDAHQMEGVLKVIDDRSRNLVGVIAETPGILNQAMQEVSVTWDKPGVFTTESIAEMLDIDTALANDDLEHVLEDGALDTTEPWTLDTRFDQPPLHHAAQELRCAVAEFSEREGREVVDVWTGSQDTFVNQRKAAAELGVSIDRVTIHNMRIGGGFGGRVLYDVVREAVLFAKAIGRPVKVEWSRHDEFLADRMRPPSSHRIRARVDAGGKITDWWHACRSGYVLLTEMIAPEPALSVARYFLHDRGSARGLTSPYLAARKRVELGEVALPFHVGEWRSLGAAPNIFAIESAVDELARKLELDPVEFRLKNLGDEHARLKYCLQRARELADRVSHVAENGRGRGYACGIYDENTYVAAAFDVQVESATHTIQVDRCVTVLDAGLAISPDQIKAQIEGCAMMSIGQLLSEAAPINAGLSAHSFVDYPTPVMKHVPDFEHEIINHKNIAPAGVGQAPIIAQVAALANAYRDATGIRLRTLPAGE